MKISVKNLRSNFLSYAHVIMAFLFSILFSEQGLADVINGGFDQGTDNWEFATHGAAGSGDIRVGVQASPSGSVLAVEIDSLQGGVSEWSTRVLQRGVAVESGRHYRFSADVRAENRFTSGTSPAVLRAMVFRSGMNGHQADSGKLTLSNSWQSISYTFQAETNEAVPYFMYAFAENIGRTILVDNVSIVQVSAPNSSANLLRNADFNLGVMDWNAFVPGGNTQTDVAISANNNTLAVNIYSLEENALRQVIDTSPWGIRARQYNVPVVAGNHYRFSLDVRSQNGPASLIAAVHNSSSGEIVTSGPVSVNSSGQQLIMEFTAPSNHVMPYLMFGYSENVGNTVFVENISMVETGVPNTDNLAVNGDFNQLQAHWDLTTPGAVIAEVVSDGNNHLSMDIDAVDSSAPPWAIRARQWDIPVLPGEIYRYSVRARSLSGPGAIRTAVYDPHVTPVRPIVDSKRVELDGNWQEITFEFVAGDSGLALAYFMFAYADNVGRQIQIDDFSVRQLDETPSAIFQNLLQAGVSISQIQLLDDETVLVGGDLIMDAEEATAVLEASQDPEGSERGWRNYQATRILASNIRNICIDTSPVSDVDYYPRILDALQGAVNSFNSLDLQFRMRIDQGIGVTCGPASTFAIEPRSFAGRINEPLGSARGPNISGHLRGPLMLNIDHLRVESLSTLQAVLMHEMGHLIGLQHTDFISEVSCEDVNPFSFGRGIRIPGTPEATPGGSLMNSCPFPTKYWTQSDIVTLNYLFGLGSDDLVLRDDTGQVAGEVMFGPSAGEDGPYHVGPPEIPDSFTIRGMGDITSDGVDDIIWQDDNRQIGFWRLKGGQFASAGTIFDPENPLLSEVERAHPIDFRGVGDMNGDGTDDLVWRENSGVGPLVFWPMFERERLGETLELLEEDGEDPVRVGLGDLVAVGDMNGDGTDDLIMHDATENEEENVINIHFMRTLIIDELLEDVRLDNPSVIGETSFRVDSQLEIVATGDLSELPVEGETSSSLGTDDIIVRNRSTGELFALEIIEGEVVRVIDIESSDGSTWIMRAIGNLDQEREELPEPGDPETGADGDWIDVACGFFFPGGVCWWRHLD